MALTRTGALASRRLGRVKDAEGAALAASDGELAAALTWHGRLVSVATVMRRRRVERVVAQSLRLSSRRRSSFGLGVVGISDFLDPNFAAVVGISDFLDPNVAAVVVHDYW